MSITRSLLATLVAVALISSVGFAQDPASPAAEAPKQSPIDAVGAQGPDAVVAVVNGQNITKKQLDEVVWGFQAAGMLDKVLITNALVSQKAKEVGVSLTQADIDEKIAEFEKRPDLQGKKVDEALSEVGISKDAWVNNFIVPQALAEKIVNKELQVADTDVAQYIKARHILVRAAQAQTEEERTQNEEAAKAKIDQIAEEVKNGLSFEEAANQHSEDPGNTDPMTQEKKGGDLGWFKRDRMIPEFSNVAFALKPGEISEPTKTYHGYHLIKVEKLGKDADDAEKAEITSMITQEQMGELTRKFWQDLRAEAVVDNKLVVKPAPMPAMPPPPAAPPAHEHDHDEPAEAAPTE